MYQYNPSITSLNVCSISEHQHCSGDEEERDIDVSLYQRLDCKFSVIPCCLVLAPDSLKIKGFSAEGMKEEREALASLPQTCKIM